MTRKDYIAIAEALSRARPDNIDPIVIRCPVDAWDQWLRDRRRLADALYADNPRFDRDRFYSACEGKE